jgi:ATP-dependent protease ClpP protease subunit
MNNKRKFDYEDEDSDGPTGNKVLPYAVQAQVRNTFMFKLDEPVTEPSYYRNVVDVCMQAKEDDTIIFQLNTPGGLFSGLSTILDAISRTDAFTVAAIQGDCSSAGSIIAMHCDIVDVGLYSSMLCHHVSYGTAGKDADIIAYVVHTTKQSSKLIQDTYEGFMTNAEIAQLLDGKQFYFDAEEIVTRLEARDEYREEQSAAWEERKIGGDVEYVVVADTSHELRLNNATKSTSKPAKKTTKPKE